MSKIIEDIFTELYISNVDKIGGRMPLWFNGRRREYLEAFRLSGIPERGDERYRLCDMQKLFNQPWEVCMAGCDAFAEGFGNRGECACDSFGRGLFDGNPVQNPNYVDGYKIDLLNGFVKGGGLEVLDNGVIYGSLRAAIVDFEQLVRDNYNTVAPWGADALVALNSVFVQDGVFIYVPKGVIVDKPFVVNHNYAPCRGENAICFGRELLVFEQGAKADVMLVHNVAAGRQALVSYVREIVADKGADICVAEYSNCSADNKILFGSYANQSNDSRLKMVMVELGGGLSRIDSVLNLNGQGADAQLYTLFMNNGREQSDVNIDVNHIASDCTSNQSVKGVVSGEAQGGFTGRVYVAPGAQRTNAFQRSKNLELSDTARINVKPQLEIYADDVKCSHGATVGQLDDQALFYMRQRGLSEDDARRLQLLGFVNDIISHFPTTELASHIFEVTSAKINQM